MKKIAFVAIISSLFLFSGCAEDEPRVTDPQKAILGKWEVTQTNLGPQKPNGYVEYLSDSIRLFYSYTDKSFSYEKYWLNDSILIRSFEYRDPYDNETTVFKWQYRYEFVNHNEMHLEFLNPAIQYFFVYKRLK